MNPEPDEDESDIYLEQQHYDDITDMLTLSLKTAVIKVVQKLPEDVRQYVFENCQFWVFPGLGLAIPLEYDNGFRVQAKWLIILSHKIPILEISHTIAHEIAHTSVESQPKYGSSWGR